LRRIADPIRTIGSKRRQQGVQDVGIGDDAVEVRAQGWRTLAALHGLIDTALEKALQAEHHLSVVEYTVLDALSRQDGWHMRMQQLARAAALSSSATTRLVNRLEDRGLLTRILCQDDRRGIYTELTEQGWALLNQTRPTHDEVLATALAQAEELPELAPLVDALKRLPTKAPYTASR
jgi:DNA-binding MarR family transcriptional regulator